MDLIDCSLLVNVLQLSVLSVQLVSHINCNPMKIIKYVSYGSISSKNKVSLNALSHTHTSDNVYTSDMGIAMTFNLSGDKVLAEIKLSHHKKWDVKSVSVCVCCRHSF